MAACCSSRSVSLCSPAFSREWSQRFRPEKDLQNSLRANSGAVFGAAHRFRISRLLVIGQIALAVVVITSAGVMLRSLLKLVATDPGFRTAQTLTAQISLDRTACSQKGSCAGFFDTLINRAQGLPGVATQWLWSTPSP